MAPPAATCQNCVPGLHRVKPCLHVVNNLSHHGSQVLQQVATAASACCLEGCDGVLGLLGASAGSDELLLQSGVLQVGQGYLLSKQHLAVLKERSFAQPPPYHQPFAKQSWTGSMFKCLQIQMPSNELLLQSAVLQEEAQASTEGRLSWCSWLCATAKAVHSKDLPGWLCANE